MSQIVNAAPMTILRGIQDLSSRTVPPEAEVLPTHLPKVYIYAQKGPTTPELVVGNSRTQMYGDETFDERGAFTTHQTILSNKVNAEGNAQMIERVLPSDIGPRANFTLWVDLLQTEITVYQRNPDGSYVLDELTGAPVPAVPAATVDGYKVKWVMTSETTKANESKFGTQTQAPGDQTDGVNQSVRYPVLQWWASSYGSVFNLSGLRLSAPTQNTQTPIDEVALTELKAYPFRISAIRKAKATSTPALVLSEFGEAFFDFCLKTGQVHPSFNSEFYLGDIFLDKYQNLNDPAFPKKYGDFGGMEVYQSNIDDIVELLYSVEKENTDVNTDFSATGTDEAYMVNFFTCTNSNGAPYNAIELVSTEDGAVYLTESTNLYASGATDGTMDETELFPDLVAERVAAYADETSPLQDTAMYPESYVYDTGFPLETKYELIKFIALRRDTFVVLSTYTVGGPELSAANENSIALSLMSRVQSYPESDYFGTHVVRGLIMGRYGQLKNSNYRKKLPITIELATMAARMMGAGDGRWNEGFLFDRAPRNQINMFKDINVTFTSTKVRNKDWDVGLNWVQTSTRSSYFIPALQTVYNNDTSVLNSFFFAACCVEMQKVAERVWRLFSGSVSLDDGQLFDRVNRAVEERSVGRFASLFKIVPAAYKTEADTARGYSYTLPISIYGNNMSTVATVELKAYRMSDFE
jgi:hypothetical protein